MLLPLQVFLQSVFRIRPKCITEVPAAPSLAPSVAPSVAHAVAHAVASPLSLCGYTFNPLHFKQGENIIKLDTRRFAIE